MLAASLRRFLMELNLDQIIILKSLFHGGTSMKLKGIYLVTSSLERQEEQQHHDRGVNYAAWRESRETKRDMANESQCAEASNSASDALAVADAGMHPSSRRI